MHAHLPGGWRRASFWMLTAVHTAVRETPSPADPVVRTMQGRLVGMTEGGVHVFRVWRPPEPPAEWGGRRFAMSFSPQCTQLPCPEGGPLLLATMFGLLFIEDWRMLVRRPDHPNFWIRLHVVRMILAFSIAVMAPFGLS